MSYSKKFYSKKNGEETNIKEEERVEVLKKLYEYDEDHDNSMHTGDGRVYNIEKGKIYHNISRQPTFIVESETEKGLEKLLKKFEFPL